MNIDFTTVLIALIAAVPLIITAWAAMAAARRSGRAAEHTEKLNSGWAPQVTQRLDEIKKSEEEGHKQLKEISDTLTNHIDNEIVHKRRRFSR